MTHIQIETIRKKTMTIIQRLDVTFNRQHIHIIDRTFQLVGASNVNINKILSKLSMNFDNDQTVLQLIFAENKRMGQRLAVVLTSFSAPNQQEKALSLDCI
ncbi:unnamed protein product [Rotaria sp. Silwood2]|nr:unnamed protein product [Rotaria sp. Silwood2]